MNYPRLTGAISGDGLKSCQCEKCTGKTNSELVWGFVNRVAGEKPTAEEPWFFMVGRNRVRGGKTELQGFNKMQGGWRTLQDYGRLEIR